jgi:hypothetical protein
MTFLTRDSSNHERIEQPSAACKGRGGRSRRQEQEQAQARVMIMWPKKMRLWRVTDIECRWYNKLY